MPGHIVTHPDGNTEGFFAPTDEELAIVAEGQRAPGESLEHAVSRFSGFTASMAYVFSDPPEAQA